MEVKRQKVYEELITTERQYIQDMKMYVSFTINKYIFVYPSPND